MKYRLVIHENAIEDIRRNSIWWKHHRSRESLLIQKGAQTFLSVVFDHLVLKADKNVYPPFKLFFEFPSRHSRRPKNESARRKTVFPNRLGKTESISTASESRRTRDILK